MDREQFIVDVMDPDDVRAKLEDARNRLRDREAELAALRDLEQLVNKWRLIVKNLESLLPETTTTNGQPRSRSAPASDLAAEVVNREMRKIRSRDVHATLVDEGHNLTPNQVSNALFYAANKAQKIKVALGRGMYAPLAYTEPEMIFASPTGEASSSEPEGRREPRGDEDRGDSPGDS